MAVRRRLPVLKNTNEPSSESDDDEARPPWHWIGFGTVAIFAAWLPLAYVAQAAVAKVLVRSFGDGSTLEAISARLATASDAERYRWMALLALPNVMAFAVASFAGGLLVGRYGPRAGAREAALAGFVTALFAIVIGWGGLSLIFAFTALVLLLVATGFAAWGGRFGASKR